MNGAKHHERQNDLFDEAIVATNFARVLDQLRTEEDRFFFTDADGARLVLSEDDFEKPLGWDAAARSLTLDAQVFHTVCGALCKDWSGVRVRAGEACRLTINGVTVKDPRRLRAHDRLVFHLSAIHGGHSVQLTFHEPIALNLLDALLPLQTDRPDARPSTATCAADSGDATIQPAAFHRLYFKAFTLRELFSLLLCTLIASVLIYFCLASL